MFCLINADINRSLCTAHDLFLFVFVRFDTDYGTDYIYFL